MRFYPHFLFSLLPALAAAAVPDFEKEIAPILEARCLSCHDATQKKGDVSLDTHANALASIMRGKPDESPLIDQISGSKPKMPKKAAPLSAAEVETLRRWVAAGAPWPEGRVLKDNPPRNLDWWSLRPITATEPPTGVHPVDHYIDAKLSECGLKPVAEVDAATLIRRMTYDLIGLPPTPEEVEAFVAGITRPSDKEASRQGDEEHSSTAAVSWSSPQVFHALEALATRLLASPAFGEKWARHWLDVARYGETHGYDKDKPRMNAWPYRDYVIRAFNDDKPYDRFVQEQIAGDALFPGERDGVLGLGFLAAGPWDLIAHTEVGEGKLDGRIAKHLDRDEMVAAVFNVFTSTTVQCAQCHHHKFDPVKMEDYYRLHAVFAAVDRADRVYAGLPPEQEHERNSIVARINALQAEKDRLDSGLKRAIAARTSGLDRRIAELKAQHGTATRPQYGWHSSISKTQNAIKWVQVDFGMARVLDHLRIIPAYDTYAGIGAGFGFPLRYKVEAAEDADFKTGVRLLRDATAQDQPNPKTREVIVEVGGAPVRFIRITATRLVETTSSSPWVKWRPSAVSRRKTSLVQPPSPH